MQYACELIIVCLEERSPSMGNPFFISIFLITLFILPHNSFAQDESVKFNDSIYKASIHTVQLYVDPLVLTDPVLPLNGPSQLHLGFDDLDGEKKDYFLTVMLCNYDWSASDMSKYDYTAGFTELEIRDYKFSSGTNQSYTHYGALFPNADFRITKSGNYILNVYEVDNPENLVLTRRFIVVDSKAEIVSNVNQADDVRFSRTYQQVNFSVLHRGMDISNSFSEIKVKLLQNFRWDNAIQDIQPRFVRSDQLDYEHISVTSFQAGKEFRYFDTRTLRYKSDRIQDIQQTKNQNTVVLFPDQSRSNTQSFSRKDIDGKFIPGTQDYPDQDSQADYVWVKFSLPVDYTFNQGKVYVFGKLTDWQLLEPYLMQYNPATKSYELTVYLKQGYYEYEYYFKAYGKTDDEDGSLLLEGNSFDTENSYQILVYYHPFGTRYDQVIGYKSTDTFNR